MVRAIALDAIAHLQFIELFQFLTVGGVFNVQPTLPPPLPRSHNDHIRADSDDDDEDIADIGSLGLLICYIF